MRSQLHVNRLACTFDTCHLVFCYSYFRLVHLGYKTPKRIARKMSLKLICGGLASKFQALSLKNVVLPAVNLHTTAIASGKINRMKDRTSMLRTVVKKGDGAVGEKSVDLDNIIQRFVAPQLTPVARDPSSKIANITISFITANNLCDSPMNIYRSGYMAKQRSKICQSFIFVCRKTTQS